MAPWGSSRGDSADGGQDGPPDRVPPGQYLTDDFPVLSAGPTPHTPLEEWTFDIRGGAEPVRWTWEELQALPSEEITKDIHCVTKWSKLDTVWQGVSVDTLLEAVEHDAEYALAFCDGGYTTNLPHRGPHRRQGLGRLRLRRRAARARARRPRAAARAAPLLLEERQVGARPRPARRGRAGLLGAERLPPARRSVAGAAVLGRLTWLEADVASIRDETPRVQDARPRRRGLGRPPRRPAPGRAPDRRGRLPGAALATRSPRRRASRSRSRSSGSRTARSRPTSSTRCGRATASRCAGRSAATSSGTATSPSRCCSSPAARASCRSRRWRGTAPGSARRRR